MFPESKTGHSIQVRTYRYHCWFYHERERDGLTFTHSRNKKKKLRDNLANPLNGLQDIRLKKHVALEKRGRSK